MVKKMKKLTLLLLVLMLGLVSAAEINAPKEIPANLNWSFSVDLNPSNEFTETEIYFDDLLIVTAYNDKTPIIEEDFVLKAFLFDKQPEDNTGLTVFISYFGIQEGSHSIKTKTFNQGNLTEEKEFEVKSVDTITAIQEMPETFKEDVGILMKEIINKINDSKQELDLLKSSTEQNVQEKTSVLEQEITELENALNELNKLKEETEKQNELTEQNKNSVTAAENKTQENSALTGFYDFSVNHAWMGAVFLIVLLVLLALFQVYKMKSNQTVFEEVLSDKDLDKEFEDETSLEDVEEESKPKRKGKKFSIRDLLKH